MSEVWISYLISSGGANRDAFDQGQEVEAGWLYNSRSMEMGDRGLHGDGVPLATRRPAIIWLVFPASIPRIDFEIGRKFWSMSGRRCSARLKINTEDQERAFPTSNKSPSSVCVHKSHGVHAAHSV